MIGKMIVFITGSSGFIGRVLLGQLQGEHQTARCLVRDRHHYQPTAEHLSSQMGGCDAVVHLAVASGSTPADLVESNVALTSALLKAAVRTKVRRFVHISSISVYGEPPPDGLVDERSPRLASLQAYAAMKQACERLVLAASDQLEVVVLQPSIVYGPGGGWWTAGLLEAMTHQVWPLVAHGRGHCHPVHVSDVARAIRLALVSPSAPGHCFLITGPRVSWRQFLRSYEKLLQRPSLLSMPRSWLLGSESWPSPLRRVINKLIRLRYGRSLAHLSAEQVSAFSARPRFDGCLAEELLGFRPLMSLESGMADLARFLQVDRC